MSQPTHEYYNCTEAEDDRLLVDEYSDSVYFYVVSDENCDVFLNKSDVQKLVDKLTNWLEKSKI